MGLCGSRKLLYTKEHHQSREEAACRRGENIYQLIFLIELVSRTYKDLKGKIGKHGENKWRLGLSMELSKDEIQVAETHL